MENKDNFMNAVMRLEYENKDVKVYTSTRGDVHLVLSKEPIHDPAKFISDYHWKKCNPVSNNVRLYEMLIAIESISTQEKWFFRRMCENYIIL